MDYLDLLRHAHRVLEPRRYLLPAAGDDVEQATLAASPRQAAVDALGEAYQPAGSGA